jgi:hypothetical protein
VNTLYFAALQSFVVLAQTKRMKEATQQLGVSRQTIMRHISYLEEQWDGDQLLSLDGNAYSVKPSAEEFFRKAEEIVEQARALEGGHQLRCDVVDGLERVHFITADGQDFRSQQHPLWRLDEIGTKTIKTGYAAWMASGFDVNHPQIQALMPLMSVFREQKYGWVCTHVGEISAYARCFGKDWAMSATGVLQSEAPTGRDYQLFVSHPYKRVLATGSCRIDHQYLKLKDGHRWPLNFGGTYQRLLMPLLLPDGSPVLASLAIITNEVEFAGFEPPIETRIPEHLIMD